MDKHLYSMVAKIKNYLRKTGIMIDRDKYIDKTDNISNF